jgi:hypothetical protein
LSKVLETLRFNRLNQHLQSNKIFIPEQFRFRKGNNNENANFTLMDTILFSPNHWQQITGMFCNLSKASDCLNHVILVNKLFHYGVRGKCDYWIKFYLTNRKQKVNMSTQNSGEESSSSWETLNSGVPQDFVLNLYKRSPVRNISKC